MKKETTTQRKRRLLKAKYKRKKVQTNVTDKHRVIILNKKREHFSLITAIETLPQSNNLLETNLRVTTDSPEKYQALYQRERITPSITNTNISFDLFQKSINTHCDRVCAICLKRCYPNQVLNHRLNTENTKYLPAELTCKKILLLCRRCKKHLSSNKNTPPSRAYFNNMDPGNIPDVIKRLTQPEQRLLSRIIPFIKIVKFNGAFGQNGFRGQAILFPLDMFEVTESLLNVLPRSTGDLGMVLVSDCLENLNKTHEFSVSRTRVYEALEWLIIHNPLYKDVVIDHHSQLQEQDFIRVTEQANKKIFSQSEVRDHVTSCAFVPINGMSRILRASWHQGSKEVFGTFSGMQCLTMVLANIVRAAIQDPCKWTNNILDINMLEGDVFYTEIRRLSENNNTVPPIDDTGFLEIRHLNVIENRVSMFGKEFSIEYEKNSNLYGNLKDSENRNSIGMTLNDALTALFLSHKGGALICNSYTFGVLHYENKYYFTNSHSCGPKGVNAFENYGKACIIQCDNLQEFVRICKRATGCQNSQFTLNFIDVHVIDKFETTQFTNQEELNSLQSNHINNTSAVLEDSKGLQHKSTSHTRKFSDQNMNEPNLPSTSIPVQTSVMIPIDSAQPTEGEGLEISYNVNQVKRKTKHNIVKEAHETKAEEFSWFYLFPYGVNGLKELRPVKITLLDYFQCRILGNDTRFQRNDYLFYALSMYEFYKVKSTINACCKRVKGQDGKVEDVHLYLKNLRGSAAYWRAAMNELLAQIRCIGPPTYFVTFSCNDINWTDMRKALLIADGRPEDNPDELDIIATQRLIEQYPVIVCRHFMVRVYALMKFIRGNNDVFGGAVNDFWWQIEFQNRGSPHLHMLVWVEGHAPFDTDEGLRTLNNVCSCEMPPEASDMRELVRKLQEHRHTHTCFKNTDTSICRFGFPREECNETRIVAHSSDDFVKNGGRLCVLKRRKEEAWISNYNSILLKLWQGSMDIQPCGSNEAIAFYIAKYLSKSEPNQLNSSVAQAIRQIRLEETGVSSKLFKVCMRILKERQVSACECVYRLCHLNLKESSRKCIFLNTRKPDQRYKLLKFNENGQATGCYGNIFDRYEKRPVEHSRYAFENMCLLEFAMLFEPYYVKSEHDSEESIDQHQPEEQIVNRLIKLRDNSEMIIRNIPAVVRVPYFVAASDSENYFYSLLVQYVPYRDESELLSNYGTAKQAFLARESHLKDTNTRLEMYRQRDRQLENAFNQIHAFEILNAEE